MKKIIAMLLSLSMFVCVFSGCESTSSKKNRDDDDDEIESEETDSQVESSEFDESTEESENEESKTEEFKQPEDEKEENAWVLGEFKDEFERPVGKIYMVNSVSDGTFKNDKNSTKKYKLTATVQVTSNAIAIYLWEYGNSLVGSSDSLPGVLAGNYSKEYNITVLDSNGKKHYFTGCMESENVFILIADEYENELLEILKEEGNISFYLERNTDYGSTYLFTINANGFNEMYSQIQ